MDKTKPEYRRLTRTRSRVAVGIISTGRCSLWLGNDHLLAVETNGYTENYKRFHFRDIQAILIRQTSNRMVWGLIYGGLALFFAAIAFLPGDFTVAVIFGPFAGLALLGLALNLIAGPTCATQLHTAVQVEELPSLARIRKTRKILARLRPLIAEAQGQFTPEELVARVRESRQSQLAGNVPIAWDAKGSARYVIDDPAAPPRVV
jgi:ribosomal protein L29